ncbi:GDNF family receptor alpha-4 isoform 6 [Mus musculus]|uniref:GDNF family receptor alpha-4 isoform 6 n=1 Tax=Mus musculus TaxID=10090 RepID=UPI00201F10C0|nr:GDNF family receptor alpha-4 isoform 6 [Mus musculus]
MSVAQSKLPGPWVLFTSHHVWCGRWTVCTCHDGAIQAFDSLQPSVLQDQTAGCCFPRVSWLYALTALALQALL